MRIFLRIQKYKLILIEGKIFRQGSSDELAADEKVRKLYLGESFRLDRYNDPKNKAKK